MRSDATPIIDGEYCSEWESGKPCPFLLYEDECDTMCSKYEKVPHPVWDGKSKSFRLRRCPQCLADEKAVAS